VDGRRHVHSGCCDTLSGVIDLSWPAVVCSHGRLYKWELGLIADNPVRYVAAWVQLIVGWGLFFVGAAVAKRYRT